MSAQWGSVLVVLAGAALVALGVWALTLKPRTATTRAFGAYALGTGAFLAVAWSALAWPDAAGLPSIRQGSPILLLLALGLWSSLIVLVLGVPRPIRWDERRLLVRPTLLGVGFFAAVTVSDASNGTLILPQVVNNGNWAATFVAIGIALERFREAAGPAAPHEREHLALLACALSLIVGEATGRILVDVEGTRTFSATPLVIGSTVVLLILAVAWLRVSANVPAPSARHARDAALLLAGAWLFGGAWQAAAGSGAGQMGSFGITTLLGGVLLARGALVGNLLGADVQLRSGISKSTIAAAFVAVFFVASEVAQQAFGATFGGAYAGIIAAGGLVFAMAPLQRAAERLAERAVPVAQSSSVPVAVSVAVPGRASAGKEQAYRSALRAALRDKVLTREEEIGLAHLSDELGLSHRRAREIWHDVEAEAEAKAEERAG